jgi:hypothetical protein
MVTNIIPQVIPALASGSNVTLELLSKGTPVNGKSLTLADVEKLLQVQIKGAGPKERFTLVVVDPDAPKIPATTPKPAYLNAIITNILGEESVNKADMVTDYIAPRPSNTPQRLVYLLYRQPKNERIRAVDPALETGGRANFRVADFAKRHDLGLPVAAEYVVISP